MEQSQVGVPRTVSNSHVIVFCSIPLVFSQFGVLRTVNGAAPLCFCRAVKLMQQLADNLNFKVQFFWVFVFQVMNNEYLWSFIIHAIKKKETVRRKLKSIPSDVLRVKFKELRARVKQLVSYYRAHFFQSLDADLHTNPKRFWSLFKLKKKDSTAPGNVSSGARSSRRRFGLSTNT